MQRQQVLTSEKWSCFFLEICGHHSAIKCCPAQHRWDRGPSMGRGCSSVVERSLCMRKAPGSIPGISTYLFWMGGNIWVVTIKPRQKLYPVSIQPSQICENIQIPKKWNCLCHGTYFPMHAFVPLSQEIFHVFRHLVVPDVGIVWHWLPSRSISIYAGCTKHCGSGGIRTHASEETGALNQRLRPLGHATSWKHGSAQLRPTIARISGGTWHWWCAIYICELQCAHGVCPRE